MCFAFAFVLLLFCFCFALFLFCCVLLCCVLPLLYFAFVYFCFVLFCFVLPFYALFRCFVYENSNAVAWGVLLSQFCRRVHLLLGVWILIQVRTISYNLCACLLFAYALACTPCFWADLPICFFDFGERVASWLSRERGILCGWLNRERGHCQSEANLLALDFNRVLYRLLLGDGSF